ncbi:dehydrogenase/reductase SDR family member 7B isoform X6 [Equus asinus]|uniref:dehydrogenase/reductase SDR family member 7B isoform X6 n=1 Tax=Equus asinus TaxID=9793 RepID=UPI0038F79EB8
MLHGLLGKEESAEGGGHGLHHLHGHPAPVVWLCGNLQPLQAAAAAAHEGLPAERCGGHHRRHLGTGARMRQSLLCCGCEAGALWPEQGGPGRAHQRTRCFSGRQDPGTIVAATAEILQCFGHVDVLINNAGVSYRGAIVDTTMDVDKRVMETNYFGPIALTKALLPSMIQRRQGHVVAISSIQGKISLPFRSAYAASKHATQAFFDCLRAEVEQCGIEVTVISPSYIHTSLSLNAVTADGSRYGVMDEKTAQGRSPVEVARDVLAAVGKRKKDVILADLLPSLAVYLRTLAPGLFFSLMASRARKERKSKTC